MDTIETLERAMEQLNAGDFDGAEAACHQVLDEEINNSDAYYVLGLIEYKRRHFEQAEEFINKAIGFEKNAPWYFIALAEVHTARGNYPHAVEALKQSLLVNSDQPQVFEAASKLLVHMGRHDEHVEVWKAFTRVAPNNPVAFNNLGTTLLQMRRPREAIEPFRRAIALNPGLVDAHTGLAMALAGEAQFDAAMQSADRAVELAPNDGHAHYSRAMVLFSFSRRDEAIASFERAVALAPDLLDARERLATLLAQIGEVPQAVEQWEQIARSQSGRASGQPQLLCALNYLPDKTNEEIFAAHRKWGQDVTAPYLMQARPHSNMPEPYRQLRVGYLSADMRYHAVSMFLRPILQNHRDAQVESICFADVRRADEMTQALEDLSDAWHPLTDKNQLQIAELIRNEAVDILVDLSGHNAPALLEVAALKPAPVQISYIGYCATTGMPAFDYVIGDSITDPPSDTQPYVEKLIRIPGCFTCYGPLQSAPAVNELPAESRGFVTFGSFNSLEKLNDRVLDLWSRILKQLPTAKLLIRRDTLSDRAQARLRGAFSQRGITDDRLILRRDLPGDEDKIKLSIFQDVDIALDAFPWSGHATSCNALWMGVPYLTLRGRNHAGRMAASTVTHAGFPEFVADNEDDYVRIATALAGDLPKLAELRRSIRPKMAASVLCDGEKYILGWEAALRDAWKMWCAKKNGLI